MCSQASALHLHYRPPCRHLPPITENTYTHAHICMHACTLSKNRQIETFQSSHRLSRQILLSIVGASVAMLPQYWVTVGTYTGQVWANVVVKRHWKLLPISLYFLLGGTSTSFSDSYTCFVSSAPTLPLTGGLSLTAKSFALHSSSHG